MLAAHQLVAELAQIYYEKPNDDTARAVVAVPPSAGPTTPHSSTPCSPRVAGNPIIQPVTSRALFATFARRPPPATAGAGSCRAAAARACRSAAIRTQRQRIDGFASAAAPTARSLSAPLGDLVLAGESELLRPAQQSAVLGNTRRPWTPSWPSCRWRAAGRSP